MNADSVVHKQYFGPLWDSPATDPSWDVVWCEVPTPVGVPCSICTEPIMFGDRGEIVATMLSIDSWTTMPMHIECHLANLMGCYFGVCMSGRHGKQFVGTYREYAFAVLRELNARRAAQGHGPL